jgi:hypothetical protein
MALVAHSPPWNGVQLLRVLQNATAVELSQLTEGNVPAPFRLRPRPGLTGWRTESARLTLVPRNLTSVILHGISCS